MSDFQTMTCRDEDRLVLEAVKAELLAKRNAANDSVALSLKRLLEVGDSELRSIVEDFRQSLSERNRCDEQLLLIKARLKGIVASPVNNTEEFKALRRELGRRNLEEYQKEQRSSKVKEQN
ncbi:MAG: hypothetical protein V4671_28195 [Armatimonadota bacterium]